MLQDDELYSGYDEGSNPLAVSCIRGMLIAMHQLHVPPYHAFPACYRTREGEDSRRCRRELVGITCHDSACSHPFRLLTRCAVFSAMGAPPGTAMKSYMAPGTAARGPQPGPDMVRLS